MSRCYSIACTQCRKHIWIAQAGFSGYVLYYGQPHTMKALRDFLFEHAKHPLVFDENEEGSVSEMDEIEVVEPAKDIDGH